MLKSSQRAWDRIFWEHPEWWCLALSGIAWLLLIQHSISHWGHEHHHYMSPGEELFHWLLMISAMMLPLTLEPVRMAAFRSMRSNRHGAIAGVLVGYFVIWMAAGVPAVWLHSFAWTHSMKAAAIAFAVAFLWLLVPIRKRALAACHRTVPIAPRGWRAHLSCLRYGHIVGSACVISCWPMMLACTLTGHSLLAMVGGTAVSAIERLSFKPPVRAVLAGNMALAMYYAVLAVR